jgi:hypothetical protein
MMAASSGQDSGRTSGSSSGSSPALQVPQLFPSTWRDSHFLLRSITGDLHFRCCGSGMFIPDPGSEFFPSRISVKEFKYFNPKKWSLSFRKYDLGCSSSSRIPILTFYPSRIQGPKDTGSRIRIRNTVHCINYLITIMCRFLQVTKIYYYEGTRYRWLRRYVYVRRLILLLPEYLLVVLLIIKSKSFISLNRYDIYFIFVMIKRRNVGH